MSLSKSMMLFLIVICLCAYGYEVNLEESKTPELYLEPIYKVNGGDATADKPQSKSWANKYGQWVIFASDEGPRLLKKDAYGWTAQSHINQIWQSLPGRADVTSKGNDVQLVLVEKCRLNVAKLKYSTRASQYKHQWAVDLPIPENCKSIETATIIEDARNQFWVCADMNNSVMVWYSTNGKKWSEPITLADDINDDDISLIVSLKNHISVIWSNQNNESIMERIHHHGDAPTLWSAPKIIQQGGKNADDHLNATVFENGEMALVTKNSVDKVNQPQFVLRFRDTHGAWTNIPYENLTVQESPSRPIINHVKSGRIFEMHSVRNRESGRYHISVNEIIRKENTWEFNELIQLKTKINGKNGDVTSSKASFLPHEPKLIFFSDDLGNVYSYDLDELPGTSLSNPSR